MTTTDWAATILANDDDTTLLCFADWLEDQGDAACEGVRWLVAQGKRPGMHIPFFDNLDAAYFIWCCKGKTGSPEDVLPFVVFDCLVKTAGAIPGSMTVYYDARWQSAADKHLTAILDAARAYIAWQRSAATV